MSLLGANSVICKNSSIFVETIIVRDTTTSIILNLLLYHKLLFIALFTVLLAELADPLFVLTRIIFLPNDSHKNK